MAKVTFNDITAGYASASALNASFNEIEVQFNNNVLYRNNPSGEPNQMENDLDLNGNDILNAGSIAVTAITVNGVDYLASMNTVYNNYQSITQSVTISTASPSGGSDGDIWFKIT
jgi:hypothetical protein